MSPWHHKATKAEERKRLYRRLVVVGIFFSLLLSTIGAKAVYLQVLRGPWLSEVAAKQYARSVRTLPRRGTIYDSKQRELAVSIDVRSIAASPQQIADIHSTARAISPLLGLKNETLFQKLLSERKFVWVKRHVSPRMAESVKKLGVNGLSFITEYTRFYPNKDLAAQVLGFTGVDGDGLEGIEFYFDRYLKGTGSNFTVLKDALGRHFELATAADANTIGNSLVLTIDHRIQYIAESALASSIKRFSGKSGMAIVMSPKTGAILALVNYPSFNPNAFSKSSRSTWRNRAVTDPFEPGSTMKIFTAAAALISDQFTPDSLIFTEEGDYQIGSNVIHDTHPHKWLSVTQVIKHSSNIGAAKISESIGPKALHETLLAFGFGKKTGIDCPGETAGVLLSPHQWSRMDTAAIAFGQGVSVSAIQLIRAVGAIANGGDLMRPYLVQAILDPNGGLIQRFAPHKVRQAISPKVADAVRTMMETVLDEDGTGAEAAMAGYSACGKTGTAQMVDGDDGYAEDKYIASFVGFAPAETPEIVVLAVINEPVKSHLASVVAAPVFKRIVLETLDYLNVPPERPANQLTVSLPQRIAG